MKIHPLLKTPRAVVFGVVFSSVLVPSAPATASPDGAYLQLGAGENASSITGGATWDWAWRRDTSWGPLTGYWDLSLGAWRDRNGTPPGEAASSKWSGQVGITPVLRLSPSGGSWFVEGGIGVNIIAPKFESGDKRFSTTFNFGDHIALGRRFGEAGRDEVALRFQHYSNASIKEPNPGENFLQVRYLKRF